MRIILFITSGIKRWLYRIARKHCGNNETWSFTAKALYEKYPPGKEYRFFKRDLKKAVLDNDIPEYNIFWGGSKQNETVPFQLKQDARFRRTLPKESKKWYDEQIKV